MNLRHEDVRGDDWRRDQPVDDTAPDRTRCGDWRHESDQPLGLRHGDYAGLVSRLLAVVIDVALLTVAAAVVIALGIGAAEMTLGDTPRWADWLIGVAVGVIPTAYLTVAWWTTGQTAGAMAFGIAVRQRDGRRPLGLPRSLVRALLALAFPPVWLLGLTVGLVDERRRGLLDLVVGSAVVYVQEHPGER
jgi:uncharacterized RDD family membrane protein YckC